MYVLSMIGPNHNKDDVLYIVREIMCINCLFSFLYLWSSVPRSCYPIDDVSNNFVLWILESINIRMINRILVLYATQFY